MQIKILGNGGAFSSGLSFNSFYIDHSILVETPPDITVSLANNSIHPGEISTIFISHFHGDHYFGFPFLALNLCLSGSEKHIDVFGPEGVKERLTELAVTAFGDENPLNPWLEKYICFISIKEDEKFLLEGKYSAETILTEHYTKTLGFNMMIDKEAFFCYLPDTRWTDRFIPVLEKNPRAVICDLNGEKGEESNIHMSEDDITENGFKYSENTIFYGTHLRKNRNSVNPRIKYLVPGQVIDL